MTPPALDLEDAKSLDDPDRLHRTAERRRDERHLARALDWLRSTRLQFGPPVSLIDLSAGGALVETGMQLRPGSTAALTIAGRGVDETTPFHVLRCEVVSIDQGPVYRGAGVFSRKLSLPFPDALRSEAQRRSSAEAAIADLQQSLQALRTGRPLPSEPATHAGWSRLVVKYQDGQLLKGFSQDFHPSRPQFHLVRSLTVNGEPPAVVPIAQLKAIFFVKDFAGDASYVDRGSFVEPLPGRRLEVTFLDGEVMLGSTLNYRADGTGFFVTPADPNGNNLRVFVSRCAVRHVRFF
jgi:hypothetical protein